MLFELTSILRRSILDGVALGNTAEIRKYPDRKRELAEGLERKTLNGEIMPTTTCTQQGRTLLREDSNIHARRNRPFGPMPRVCGVDWRCLPILP